MSVTAVDVNLSGWSGEQASRAATSLLKYVGTQKSSGKDLFEDEETVYMLIALKKMPLVSQKDKPIPLPVPKPLYDVDGAEICLFVKDHDGSGHKEAKRAVEKLEKRGGINKVIGVSKLRTKYESHEAKRQLCKMYDLFLADERVIPSLPKLIGKTFFKKKKQPIPINLTKTQNLPAAVKKACACTYMFKNSGTCVNIKVGTSAFSADELVANVHAALVGAAQHIPKKWSNVQGVFIKTSESVALPVWQCLPDPVSRISANGSASTPSIPASETAAAAKADKASAAPSSKKVVGVARPKVSGKGKVVKPAGKRPQAAKKGKAKA